MTAESASPAGQAAEPVPAGLFRRLGAILYDALLILALWLVTLFPIVAVSHSAVTGPAVKSLLFLELVGFFTYFWVYRGQTLGMLAWRLHIQSTAGYRLSYTQVLLRLIAATVSLACAGLGYLWILFDPLRRGWPDLFSDSVVLYTPRRRG